MKNKLIDHAITVVLVAAVFGVVYFFIDQHTRPGIVARQKYIQEYIDRRLVDWDNPAEKAIFRDVMIIYYPDQETYIDSLVQAISAFRDQQSDPAVKDLYAEKQTLTERIYRLGPMYFQFILIYAVVLLLTYYAVQTLAVWRYCRMKQDRSSYLLLLYRSILNRPRYQPVGELLIFLLNNLKFLALALAKGCLYLILFAPVYVLAYAFKTRFDTDSILFMIVFGLFSNGLLITYTQKFYTFLVNESRKGYLQTALVKNLHSSFLHQVKDGVPLAQIFRIKKRFPGHIFEHIYTNARYQYLPALKEQASFLISGLIIIEMALNIQNHLCYDLLQNFLFRDYASVLLTTFSIFLIVKTTEVLADLWYIKETNIYENR